MLPSEHPNQRVPRGAHDGCQQARRPGKHTASRTHVTGGTGHRPAAWEAYPQQHQRDAQAGPGGRVGGCPLCPQPPST